MITLIKRNGQRINPLSIYEITYEILLLISGLVATTFLVSYTNEEPVMEYATYYCGPMTSHTFINNIKIEKTPQQKGIDTEVQIISKLNEISKQGWDIYEVTLTYGNSYNTYYLRRTKNNY